jgi:hypothetical protein
VSVSRSGLLRERGTDGAVHVTNTELFFDLVYVFAFTQLSELLYDQLGLFLVGLAPSMRWLGHGRHRWPLLGLAAVAVAGFATATGSRLLALAVVTVVAAALAVWAQLAD